MRAGQWDGQTGEENADRAFEYSRRSLRCLKAKKKHRVRLSILGGVNKPKGEEAKEQCKAEMILNPTKYEGSMNMFSITARIVQRRSVCEQSER